MSKVFVNIGLSLDGYMAPEGMTMEHWDTPEYKNWGAKWGALMGGPISQQYSPRAPQLRTRGETGPVNDLVRSTAERIGANILGKRMFEQVAEASGLDARLRFTHRYTFLPMRNANRGETRRDDLLLHQ